MRASAPSQKDHKVDTSVSIRVFEWRGALHLAVDLVGPVLGRRYAPHRRLASFTVASLPGLQPPEATEWAIAQLTLWLNAGMPTDGRAAAPASPGGDRRGDRASGAPTCTVRAAALPSQAAPPPLEDRGAAGVSIQLENPEWAGMLRPTRPDLPHASLTPESTCTDLPRPVSAPPADDGLVRHEDSRRTRRGPCPDDRPRSSTYRLGAELSPVGEDGGRRNAPQTSTHRRGPGTE